VAVQFVPLRRDWTASILSTNCTTPNFLKHKFGYHSFYQQCYASRLSPINAFCTTTTQRLAMCTTELNCVGQMGLSIITPSGSFGSLASRCPHPPSISLYSSSSSVQAYKAPPRKPLWLSGIYPYWLDYWTDEPILSAVRNSANRLR
jgi:hypothetical protein